MEQRSTSKSTDKRARAAAGRGRTIAVGTSAGGGRSDDPIVGIVGAPHGVRGEVKVHPRTDVADRFRKGSRLLCDGLGEVVVASVRGADVLIVRFDGLTTRTEAERIRGRNLRVSRAEARRAAKEAYLWADLLGLRAETPDGKALGVVSEVLRAGETDVLVVRADGSREDLMLPAIASVIRDVDIAGGRIVVVPQEVLG